MSDRTDPVQANLGVKSETMERRVSVRHPCTLDTSCHPIAAPEADEDWPAKVRDISTIGIGLLTNRQFEPGTFLGIELHSSDRSLLYTLLVCVIHATAQTDGEWSLGCVFTRELSDQELQALL